MVEVEAAAGKLRRQPFTHGKLAFQPEALHGPQPRHDALELGASHTFQRGDAREGLLERQRVLGKLPIQPDRRVRRDSLEVVALARPPRADLAEVLPLRRAEEEDVPPVAVPVAPVPGSIMGE